MRFDFNRTEPYPAGEFLEALKAEVRDRTARLEHPFVQMLFNGELTHDQLRGWARQDFALKKCPSWWLAARMMNSPNMAVQRRVAGPLMEELGSAEDAHTDMYLRSGRALGLSDDEMENAPLLPSTVLAVDELMAINRDRSVVEGLGSGSVAGEAINVEFCTRFIKANDRVYKIPREGLEWFYEHIEADSGHSSLGEELVLEYATTKDMQNRVWDAAVRSKAVYWVLFEGLYQAYVLNKDGGYPHYRPGTDLPTNYPFSTY